MVMQVAIEVFAMDLMQDDAVTADARQERARQILRLVKPNDVVRKREVILRHLTKRTRQRSESHSQDRIHHSLPRRYNVTSGLSTAFASISVTPGIQGAH